MTTTAQQAGEQPSEWNALTDEDRQRAFNSMPDMLEGFMKTWGWLHFAKAIEEICREKNAARASAGSSRGGAGSGVAPVQCAGGCVRGRQ